MLGDILKNMGYPIEFRYVLRDMVLGQNTTVLDQHTAWTLQNFQVALNPSFAGLPGLQNLQALQCNLSNLRPRGLTVRL